MENYLSKTVRLRIVTVGLVFLMLTTSLSAIFISYFPIITDYEYFFFAVGIVNILILFYSYHTLKNNSIELTIIDLTLLLIILQIGTSYAIGFENNYKTDTRFWMYLCCGLIYMFIRLSNKSNIDLIRFLSTGLIIVGIVQLLWGVLQLIHFIPTISSYYRITGSFFNPGPYSNFISIILPFALNNLYSVKPGKIIFILSSVFMGLAILIIPSTNARISWIACVTAIIYVLFSRSKVLSLLKQVITTNWHRIIVGVFLSFVLIVIGILLYNYKAPSADGRIFIWQRCIEIILKNPITGVGLGNFQNTYNQQQIEFSKLSDGYDLNLNLLQDGKYAFNDYLQTCIEHGLLTGLAFWGVVLIVLYKSLSNKGKEETDEAKYYIGLKGAFISYLIVSTASYPFYTISTQLIFFIVLGLLTNLIQFKSIFVFSLKKMTLSILISLALICFLFKLTKGLIGFEDRLNWHKANNIFNDGKKEEALAMYKSLLNSLEDDHNFRYNYGMVLFEYKDYKNSIINLEEASKSINSSDILITKGMCYLKLSKIEKAEHNLLNAKHLIPYKLIPKFQLFQLYKLTNQPLEAHKMANEIINTEIKVFSKEALRIKTEAINYIENQDNHSISN